MNTAQYVKKHYPTTVVKYFKGKCHCENALFHPKIIMVEMDKVFNEWRINFQAAGEADGKRSFEVYIEHVCL